MAGSSQNSSHMPQFAACACRAPQAETLLAWLNCLFYCLCSSLCPLTLQVLGFSYGLQPEQLSYLLSEAVVGGLALEAIEEEGEVARVLNTMGLILADLQRYDEALQYYQVRWGDGG